MFSRLYIIILNIDIGLGLSVCVYIVSKNEMISDIMIYLCIMVIGVYKLSRLLVLIGINFHKSDPRV